MIALIHNFLRHHSEKLLLLVLLIVTVYTRFVNLGYSDYIGDEHKAFYTPEPSETTYQFFMNKRKGPMQFVVAHVPYLITDNFSNELAERIPFAFISVLSMVVFYLFVKKVTKSKATAFLSAFLLSVNGFIIGFGRIAQYQNLNLLFSFLTLLFYADVYLESNSKKIIKSTLLGTLFWSLSVLSHWDAIFILPVVTVFFAKFIFSKKYEKGFKLKVVALNFLLGCLLLFPYLIPYARYQLANPENRQYFERRLELGHFNFERYRLLTRLYNPFLTLPFLVVFGLLGLFLIKRSYIFSLWFIIAYLIFELFVRKPGTHMYNFIIPLIVLSSFTLVFIYQHIPKLLKRAGIVLIVLFLSFLTFQAHFIFIDHIKEYPWEQKTFLDFKNIEEYYYKKNKVKTRDRIYHSITTPKYTIEQKLPLFGFPHKRYWQEINDFIINQNRVNGESLGYMTNEAKTISEWYMDVKYRTDESFYLVGVKRPLSFSNDRKYPQIGGKNTVKEIRNEFGEMVVRIYRVESR